MKRRKRILQPVDLADGKCHPRSRESGWQVMLRPGAFFWHAGRLYVGYGWLSTFHPDEDPVWDPEPMPLDAVIETCLGYYHFSNVFSEGPPYFRKYAQLNVHYLLKPDDFGWGFLKKRIDQGTIPVNEQFVLPPDCYLEIQWNADSSLCDKRYENGRNLERKIRRAPSLETMRFSPEAQELRKSFLEDNCVHGLTPE